VLAQLKDCTKIDQSASRGPFCSPRLSHLTPTPFSAIARAGA